MCVSCVAALRWQSDESVFKLYAPADCKNVNDRSDEKSSIISAVGRKGGGITARRLCCVYRSARTRNADWRVCRSSIHDDTARLAGWLQCLPVYNELTADPWPQRPGRSFAHVASLYKSCCCIQWRRGGRSVTPRCRILRDDEQSVTQSVGRFGSLSYIALWDIIGLDIGGCRCWCYSF